MGLDMYLKASRYISGYEHADDSDQKLYKSLSELAGFKPSDLSTDSPSAIVEFGVGYWRKANQIHRWFVNNVQDGEDNCREHDVGQENLVELLNACKTVLADHSQAEKLLPSQGGFFFGSTDYDESYYEDLKHTVTILTNCVENPAFKGWGFTYRSSW